MAVCFLLLICFSPSTPFTQIVLVSPQDIAMITWACSKMGHADPALFGLLGGKAEQLLERFRPADLAQTLLAMAEAGAPHQGLFSATIRSVLVG